MPSSALRKGEVVLVREGEIIPSDGEVIDGVAYVNEAAITDEWAAVLKEPGTDIHSSVTGGMQIVSDALRIRISTDPGQTFLDRMIALVEGAVRHKTPHEIALSILLAGAQRHFSAGCGNARAVRGPRQQPGFDRDSDRATGVLDPDHDRWITVGDRDRRHGPRHALQVLAMSGRAVEAAGDIDVLLLDKTGTITHGNRLAAEILP